jgi:hypothetical protein
MFERVADAVAVVMRDATRAAGGVAIDRWTPDL